MVRVGLALNDHGMNDEVEVVNEVTLPSGFVIRRPEQGL
jgi:hypothetical protein